jgi:hypothetical protein
MNSVLVARTSLGDMVYFVVEEGTSTEKTGIVVKKSGQKFLVPFWAWVGSRNDLEEMQETEFQQTLWSEPQGEDLRVWTDVFVNRKVPFDKGILDTTPIQAIQVGAPKPKNSSGAMEMQTKVAILMMQMNERP